MLERDTNLSATALRALQVLEIVAESNDAMTVSEIARRAELDRATCYRMLRTVEQAGYIVRESNTKNFKLSRKILSLAKHLLADDESHLLVSQTLKQISAATGETCHYSELDGDSTVLTLRCKGTQLVAVDFRIGERCVLHATSVGKAILAFQDDRFKSDYLYKPLARFTEHTIIDPFALAEELDKIHRLRVAYDRYELALGMKCVAVPIYGSNGAVHAGISISGPDSRFTDERLFELGQTIGAHVDSLCRSLTGKA